LEDVKTYIESGILELYVLEQLSAQEIKEVEEMASKYSEIKSEIASIELAMENYALQHAVAPSTELESKIFSKLNISESEPTNSPKIIPLHESEDRKKVKRLSYALIACSILLVISLGALFSAHNELKDANFQIASLSADKEKFASTVSKLTFEKAGMENRIAMTETDEWLTAKLAGVKNSPKSNMLVYWNKNNKNILINYAAMNLPKTDTAHEYQLWALVDGKPVSLGIFSGLDSAKTAVLQMQTIEKAQAFAVTIEPNGGSVNPTMESMVVMGAI